MAKQALSTDDTRDLAVQFKDQSPLIPLAII
jgi:hypothetical protein